MAAAVSSLHDDHYDPAYTAPVGSYLTDEQRLIRILESDHSGAIGEDVGSDRLVELTPAEMIERWRKVTPAGQAR